jgi:hypothetical protein
VFESENGKVQKHSTADARSEYSVVGEQACLSRLLRRSQASEQSLMTECV